MGGSPRFGFPPSSIFINPLSCFSSNLENESITLGRSTFRESLSSCSKSILLNSWYAFFIFENIIRYFLLSDSFQISRLYDTYVERLFYRCLVCCFDPHGNHFPRIQWIDDAVYPKSRRSVVGGCLLVVPLGDFLQQRVLLFRVDLGTRFF